MSTEEELIGRITELQTLDKTGSFSRSSKQKRKQDEFGFLENLNLFLNFDLGKYMQGKVEVPEDATQCMRQLDHGMVKSRLFSDRTEDQNLAGSVINAITGTFPSLQKLISQEKFPFELRVCSWMHLLHAIHPSDENKHDAEAFSWQDAKRIFSVLQDYVTEHEPRGDTFAGQLTMVANRMDHERSKQVIERLVQIPKSDASLFEVITDSNLLTTIIGKDGPHGVVAFLEAVAHISRFELEVSLSDILEHLSQSTGSLEEFTMIFDELARMVATSDLNPEFISLMMNTNSTRKILRLFKIVQMEDGNYLSKDAQTICTTILKKYKMDRGSKQFQTFCNRIGYIALDKAVLDPLVKRIGKSADFAKAFILRKIKLQSALENHEDSTSLETSFYWLNMMAFQTFESHELGSITRGLAVLHWMRRESKIDSAHYSLLHKDITTDLPASLKNLAEYPDDTSSRLLTLYVPLLVAAEMLHSDDRIEYLSDAYYALKRHDRKK